MAHRRFTIDLAIPEVIPPALLQKPTPAQLTALGNMTWIEIVKEIITRLKGYSEKINAGTPKEEDTIRAKKHICRHADNLSCDSEEDI
jgi:hypothetical protein